MKSSDTQGPFSRWGTLLLALFALGLTGFTRPSLTEQYHRLRVNSDAYALPSPDHVVLMSLGYRSALADLIYAHVLVSYGLHFQDRRRFEFVGEYLDTINALDPVFRDPYRFADTLIVMGPKPAEMRDYEKAREVLERGLKNRPFDAELWLIAGQYLAYLAAPHLDEDAKKKEFRRRGAEVLARACELASSNENIPYHCIAAAGLFDKVGQREAAIRSMQRILAVNDDPEIEKKAIRYLQAQLGKRERDLAARRIEEFRQMWGNDLPFVSKDALLVLGPKIDTASCAGPDKALTEDCYTDWIGWSQAVEP